ncbi:ABC transporter substrate-binding protein [Microbacterium album]|uniref:ABC transporter substrate-binding protein n=1 Tax=Microbacterium album TaxID=2053191 RepID=A0A917IDP8_9MICO|nr:extracellular solute-binding protein [Microbacterium album]GGH42385.1 ABC transporter substrate-binding protein [Microbacterium album]
MNTSQRVAAGVAGAIAALALAACSAEPTPAGSGIEPTGEMAELISAAQAEGELTFYGDANETTLQQWTQAFTQEYGIAVNILRLPGSELNQRFLQEQSAGQHQADIFAIADRVSIETAVEQGMIAEYTPEHGDQYPEDQKMEGYFYPVQNGYFQTIAYNPTLLSEDEIARIQADPVAAAGDPAFSGRVGVNMPQSSQQIAAFYYRLAEGDYADEYGWEALEAIASNDPLFYSSATLVQNLIAGEYSIGFGITDSLAFSFAMQGAPIEFVYPESTVGGYFATSVVETAPHPNAARLFMEWATTPEANALYTEITQTIPANTEVEDSREILDVAWYSQPDVSDVWFDFIRDEAFLEASSADGDFLPRWNQVFGYSG